MIDRLRHICFYRRAVRRGRPSGNGPGGRRERLERARKSREARVGGLGWLLVGLGFLAVPVAVAIVLLVGVGGAAAGLAGGLTITAIAFFVTLGRRMKARDAERVLERDPRPPVVYLRPFESDRAPAVASPWLSRRRTRLFRSYFANTYEQRLARALRDVGPFVAVGDPTERLPQLGAARVYADDAEWRETVAGLTARATVIVLHVGESDGLVWEFQHVVGVGKPERVILGLPLETGPKRHERYDTFRRKFGDLFPRGLPEAIGESQFVFFESDWTPRLYGQRPSPRPEAAPGSPGAARALALRRLGKEFKLLVAPLWVRAAAYSLVVVLAAVTLYQLGGGAGEDVPPAETPADAARSRARVGRCVSHGVPELLASVRPPHLRAEAAVRRYVEAECEKLDELDYVEDSGRLVQSADVVYILCTDWQFGAYDARPEATRVSYDWWAEFTDRYCLQLVGSGLSLPIDTEEERVREQELIRRITTQMESEGWIP
jgi:hypothetical protein